MSATPTPVQSPAKGRCGAGAGRRALAAPIEGVCGSARRRSGDAGARRSVRLELVAAGETVLDSPARPLA